MKRFLNPRIAAAGAALGCAVAASANITLTPAVNYLVGPQPGGAAAGDFDGDKDLDLAVTVDAPDRIVLLMNDGKGAMSPGATVFLPSGSGAGEVVAGDLDGDGDVDLAVALKNLNQVRIVTNSGGVFALGATVAVGAEPRGMSIADAEGDGDLDIAVANSAGNSASILINTGGAFAATTVPVGGDPRDTAFGDFNGDGKKDLAVTNHDDRTISILTNTGAFAVTATLSVGTQVRPEGVTSADFNGDGKADIAAATNGNNGALNFATVFLSTGAGFNGPFNYVSGGVEPSDIVAAKVDCDALPDLALVNQTSGTLSALPNLGAGTFGPAVTTAVGATPEQIVAANLDGDADMDLVAVNRDSNNVSVVMNATCVKKPGDINGDGFVNQQDLGILLGAYGLCTGQPGFVPEADFDGDGCITQADLGFLLTNYGT